MSQRFLTGIVATKKKNTVGESLRGSYLGEGSHPSGRVDFESRLPERREL